MRAADGAFDGEILHRLHVKRDAGQRRRGILDPLHHRGDAGFALIVRCEVDQDSSAVERRIGAVDTDKRRQTLDVRVFQDRAGELLLPLRHRGIGHRLRRFGDRLNDTGVLKREEALRDHDIKHRRQYEGRQRDRQG